MTSVSEARAAMLGAMEPLGEEQVRLGEALGRVLATPVRASRAQPPFAASAMDGYALRAADTPGALNIVGEAAAGRGFPRALAPGEAVRISTGAPLPRGADAVLIQEEARVDKDVLHASAVSAARHVRAAGCDFGAGEELLRRGQRLEAVSIALAASVGAAELAVFKRPRVTILCGGDEITPPGETPREDQIFDSCSYAVAALTALWGGVAMREPPLADDAAQIERAAARATEAGDLVVFIGAASVGPHDHAKPALERLGARMLVRKIDMRPGKPTWFASTSGAPVLGLPGNPASALVAAALFLAPVLAKMQGGVTEPILRQARLAHGVPQNGPREAFLRARVSETDTGQLMIDASADQDSSLLSVFARANALLWRPAHAPAANAGAIMPFLHWPGGCG